MDDFHEILIFALAPLLAIGVGSALLWWANAREFAPNPLVTQIVRAIGAVTLVVGICVGIIVSAHAMSVLLLIALLIIIASAISKFYVAERQSLLWVLTVAAERGIPLESAARAFAEERNDLIGRRARHLADYLEAGVPLSLALTRARCSTTPATQLAADLGQRTGSLGEGLRKAVSSLDEGEATLRVMIERLFYLIMVLVVGTLMVTFIMLKIMPVLVKMFDDFELNMPEVTQQLIGISESLANGWIGLPLLAITGGAFVLAVLCYVGLSPRQLPILNRLWWSADCALVMHWLAVAVRQKLPLGEMTRMLAAHFPQARIRRRLERASQNIEQGQDWCDSLRAVGIFRRRENGLFKSAERAGNLAWALEEIADSGVRRAAYRIRAWANIIFPLLLVAFGGIVLFICLGMLLPLAALIQGLA